MRKRRKNKFRKRSIKILNSFVLIVVVTLVSFFLTSDTSGNTSSSVLSEQIVTIQDYNFIREIAPLAQQQEAQYGLKSSITLAQACLESNFGQSELSAKYNNLFGVKAYGGVPAVTMNTKEYENNKWVTISASFRVYSSWKASINNHTMLFVNGVDWDHSKYRPVLNAKTWQEAAKAVQSSGYATDPTYAEQLIQMIQSYQLYQYDA